MALTLDKLIAELTAARDANPEMGAREVLAEDSTRGPLPILYSSAVRRDGQGPVDPEGPEAHRIYLATFG